MSIVITLQNLKWSNCFSYGENNSISLDNEKITQLIGPNGAGKSSIPLMIEEVLFNKNSKGIKKGDITNRKFNAPYSIELELTVENTNYTIQLTRGRNVRVSLFKEGEDVSSHTAVNTFKDIESIVGMDFKTFSQLVYQNTRTNLAFLTATDTERKKFLVDLLGLSTYTDLFNTFKEEAKILSSKKVELETRVSTYKKWLDENNIDGMEVLPLINLEISTEKEETERAVLTEKIKNISFTNREIQNNNSNKQALNSINLNKFSGLEINQKVPTVEIENKIAELKATKTQSDNTIKKVEKVKGRCPTCLQDVEEGFRNSLIEDASYTISSCNDKINELEKELKEIKLKNKQLEEKREENDKFERLYKSIKKDLPEELLNKEELEEELEKVEKLIKEKNQEIQRINKENLKRERNNTQIELIQEQTEKIEKQLKEANNSLNSLNEKILKIDILKKAFSTNGLLAYKIENLVKDLEVMVNEYLLELSDGRFGLEFIIEKDKLNVYIIDNGSPVSITALSAGETAKVNAATLLAIRKLMNSLSKTKLNVLFLDEVIDVLDDEGKEKLIEVLLKEDQLSTFIVSHEWTHPLLAKIYVNKKDEVSYLDGRQ